MPRFVEPFRIKMVESISFPTAEKRVALLKKAGYNLFRLPAEHVSIDLLTDSGTGAMSAQQWGALMVGDEAYAGASSYRRFERTVRELTGFHQILPVHQGRAAERILFSTLLSPGQITVSNGHFDTTGANVRLAGAEPVDLPCPEAADSTTDRPFKGNLDLVALDKLLADPDHPQVAMVILTVTDNAGGGHPVSLDNIRETRALCDKHRISLFLDAARFAENAYLITAREPRYAHVTPREVATAMFHLAHGCWSSLKKDAIANIGGFIGLGDAKLAERCRETLIATEGYSTYGGLAGRDLEALNQGLIEATDPAYLAYRANLASWFADQLANAGLPVLRPPGCHAVYIDAGRLLAHLTPQQLPAVALAAELYLEAGVRSAEMGTLTFGQAGLDGTPDRQARRELLRLALPRRVYTRSHLEYVAEAAATVVARAAEVPGYRIVTQPPHLRHFTATLTPDQ